MTFEIRFAPCAKPMMKRFGKPCTWMPCIERMPSCPVLGEPVAVAPDGVVARAAVVARCRPRSPRRRSGSRGRSARRRPTLRSRRCARRPCRRCRRGGSSARCTPAGTRRGSTAACRAGGTRASECSAVSASATTASTAGADLLHLLVVALEERELGELGRELVAVARPSRRSGRGCAARCRSSRPCTRSSSAKPPVCSVAKFSSHSLLPAGLERREPLGIDRVVVAHVDRRRRALEHVQLAARRARAAGCTAPRSRRCR